MTKNELIDAIAEWQKENPEDRFTFCMLGEADKNNNHALQTSGSIAGRGMYLIAGICNDLEEEDIREVIYGAIKTYEHLNNGTK